jgi:FkbM family methyltransferase
MQSYGEIRIFVKVVINQIRSRFGGFAPSQAELSTWLARFRPVDNYTREVLYTLGMQLSAGLICDKLFKQIPSTLAALIDDFRNSRYGNYREKFRGLNPESTEVFCFHHGLWRLPQRIKTALSGKDFIDIGASNGDSALALAEYAGSIHSIEISPRTFRSLKSTLSLNPTLSGIVHPSLIGVSDKHGFTYQEGERIELVSVDEFVAKYNLTVGFMKADIEGLAFAMVKGARQTLATHRPVFSFSCYHTFTEMYDVSMFLSDFLPGYTFEWHMENKIDWAFFELSFFGCPNELY